MKVCGGISGNVSHMLGVGQAQQAVSADAEMPVAQETDLVCRRFEFTVGIGVYNEIIAGGVRFVYRVWNAHAITVAFRREDC